MFTVLMLVSTWCFRLFRSAAGAYFLKKIHCKIGSLLDWLGYNLLNSSWFRLSLTICVISGIYGCNTLYIASLSIEFIDVCPLSGMKFGLLHDFVYMLIVCPGIDCFDVSECSSRSIDSSWTRKPAMCYVLLLHRYKYKQRSWYWVNKDITLQLHKIHGAQNRWYESTQVIIIADYRTAKCMISKYIWRLHIIASIHIVVYYIHIWTYPLLPSQSMYCKAILVSHFQYA